MATKTELIDALIRARGFVATEDFTQAQWLTAQLASADEKVAREREQIQKILDEIPQSGKDKLKREALAQMAKEAAEQINSDSDGTSL